MLLYTSTFEIVLRNFAISNLRSAISKSRRLARAIWKLCKLGCTIWKLSKLGCAIWKLRKLGWAISKLISNFAIFNLRSAILTLRTFANFAEHIHCIYLCTDEGSGDEPRRLIK